MAICRKGFSEFSEEPVTIEKTEKGIAVVCNYAYEGCDPNKPIAYIPDEYPIEDHTLDPNAEKISLYVINCQFPWKWKFIHWWRGVDCFIENVGEAEIKVICHYTSLWETVKGFFKNGQSSES